jgi:hypothetical protein
LADQPKADPSFGGNFVRRFIYYEIQGENKTVRGTDPGI